MLLAWMAYAVLFGVLTFGTALAAERVASTWRRAQRFIWVAAVIVVTVVPAIFATRPRSIASNETIQSLAPAAEVDVTFGRARRAPSPLAHESLPTRAERVAGAADPYVARVWVVMSLAWLALLVRAAIGLRRRRTHWREVEVDGTTVLVAPNVGPAVIGSLAPRVVIPHWALSLDAPARALMLRHEAEHIRARDPLCLFGAALATALVPWNPALWLVVRRLRLAIEIDCDQRVLRWSAQQHEYGQLLLTVGARLSAPLPFATSLAERRPLLERRIRAMTALSPRHPRIVTAGCIALVAFATTAAVRAPRPLSLVERPAPGSAASSTSSLSSVVVGDSSLAAVSEAVPPAMLTPARMPAAEPLASAQAPKAPAVGVTAVPARNPDSLTVAEIRALLEAHHPTALAGDPDINTITLVVDARGNYVVSTAEARPLFIGGGRGRSGGAGPASGVGGGGDVGFSRGRVGGGGRNVATAAQDSAATQALRLEMAALMLKLSRAASDSILARQAVEMKAMRTNVMRATGDTVFFRTPNRIVLDGMVRSERRDSTKVMTEEQMRVAGAMVGLNMDVLSRLIDPQSIESIQIQTFAEGQLGTTALRVYVVHQRP